MKKKAEKDVYVLIMAGGTGTRLFPRSTEKLPKQFQKIVGEKTLIEQTYERVKKITQDDHIYVSSNHKYANLIKKHLPKIPEKNYISEPVKRNTGPAMALATGLIYKRNKNAIIIATHADHLIMKQEEYVDKMLLGAEIVKKNKDYILCVGITPTSPHTGYGYIEKDREFVKEKDSVVYKAKRFVEKPSLKLAKQYLASENFFWNAGYFVWEAGHFLEELKKQSLEIYNGVKKITNTKNQKEYLAVLNKEFHKFQDIAVDYLIMEKTKKMLVLPADIGWSDIGNWDVVTSMIDSSLKDSNGNYSEGTVINVGTRNTTVLSHDKSKVIATVGLENFIIVTAENVTVIVPKGKSEEVKKIVEKLSQKSI